MASSIAIPPVVDAETAAELLQSYPEIRILDVRTPAEFESSHIPGSYNAPLDLLGEHRRELTSAISSPVVLVCRSGNRARQAERVLREAGIEHLHILEGGLLAWEAAGKPVNRSGRETWSIERQVRGVAGALVLLGSLGGLFLSRPLGAVAAVVGGGLLFSALTNTCGMAMLLAKLPYNRDATCDMRDVVNRLASEPAGTGGAGS